jgi:hypothetical protein
MPKQLNHYIGDTTHSNIVDLKKELDITWQNVYVGIAESEEIREAFRTYFEEKKNQEEE